MQHPIDGAMTHRMRTPIIALQKLNSANWHSIISDFMLSVANKTIMLCHHAKCYQAECRGALWTFSVLFEYFEGGPGFKLFSFRRNFCSRQTLQRLLHKAVCLPELGSGQSVEQSGRSETPESVASIIKHFRRSISFTIVS
jgi:hypothetical protein